jgi:opacity protein-like surface antigen
MKKYFRDNQRLTTPLFAALAQAGCLMLLLSAGLITSAQAQATKSDSTSTTPNVTPAAGSAAALPSSEFETYNVSGKGVRYTAALTGIYSTGTVERVYFTTSHTANLELSKHWLLPAAFNFSYGRQQGLLNERELLALLTPTYKRNRVKYYLLAEGERSNLRAINKRVVLGAGVGYQLYADTLRNEVSLSQFFLYEHTDYLNGLLREVPRSSTRLKLRASKGQVVFTALAFYQPSLTNVNRDYRFNLTSGLNFNVTRHLALTAAYSYSYESIAVEGRNPANSNLTIGFTYATGK